MHLTSAKYIPFFHASVSVQLRRPINRTSAGYCVPSCMGLSSSITLLAGYSSLILLDNNNINKMVNPSKIYIHVFKVKVMSNILYKSELHHALIACLVVEVIQRRFVSSAKPLSPCKVKVIKMSKSIIFMPCI